MQLSIEDHTTTLIGRSEEKSILQDLLDSNQAEFLAIYGRRRIGKTFLIKEYFKDKEIVFFNSTGSKDGLLKNQIKHFTAEIAKVFYNGIKIMPSKSWDDTFELLTKAMANIAENRKIVLFFDELPWMATRNSRLLGALDYYWNQHWSSNHRIKLIICGSSASWIVDKIINNKGGLHNRITKHIRLKPFNLAETKNFLKSREIELSNRHIVEIYMATGGVPYYLNNIKKGLSAAQNIDLLAFTKDGLLAQEFDNLFSALFDRHELCVQIINIITERKSGVGQEEIFKKIADDTNTNDANIKGKLGLQKLQELEAAGFIMRFKPYQHKTRGIYYKVIDEYTLFYLKWIKPIKDGLTYDTGAAGYWMRQQNSPTWHSWAGISFESVCHKHINQIRGALGLDVTAIPSTWHFKGKKTGQNGAQIDLLFDRIDNAITLCEIKFTNESFSIDKVYAANIENKIQVFKNATRTKKQIFFSMISANGLQRSKYSDKLVAQIVTLEDLFEDNK